jgi:putative flavoprotein involved in K+ transport
VPHARPRLEVRPGIRAEPVTTIDVVVIGAGQAGLATSVELTTRGVPHIVLERDRVGSSWAALWDRFRVNTPNWSVRLPQGQYEDDDPDGFMSREEIVAWLQRYAEAIDAPVREGIDVTSVAANDGGFTVETSEGPMSARSVVVATGAYQRPFTPPGAEALPADLLTLTARTYRSPDGVPDGIVVIVGSGQTGCQIAEDLAGAGREVVLSCGKAPWSPRRVGDHDLVWWMLETGFMDGTVGSLPSPAARLGANVTASGVGGGHDLHPRILRERGVTLAGRFAGRDGGSIAFRDDLAASVVWGDARYLDLRRDVLRLCEQRGIPVPAMPEPAPFDARSPETIDLASVGAVIQAGGFRADYSWIRAEGLVDEWGFPRQRDGASTVVPGLSFVGVHFLRKRRSSLLCGVGEDAAIVARDIAERLGFGAPSGGSRGVVTQS